ncbi:MAG: dimethylsulfonioproprionate lyase family protein [Parvibaculaceae bacterium]
MTIFSAWPNASMRSPDAAALARLIAEIGLYLSRFGGPGVADVREGISRFGHGPMQAGWKPAPPVCGHLDAALGCISGADSLRLAIADARPALRWTTYTAYPPEAIGRRFPVAHAFASLMGGEGILPADDFELGLFLIEPKTLYRDHRHRAPELYVPLTGPHEWRFGAHESWTEYEAHTPIWNESMRVHATLVRDVPFLALFGWTRDVTADAEVVPATDWAEIEAGL